MEHVNPPGVPLMFHPLILETCIAIEFVLVEHVEHVEHYIYKVVWPFSFLDTYYPTTTQIYLIFLFLGVPRVPHVPLNAEPMAMRVLAL